MVAESESFAHFISLASTFRLEPPANSNGWTARSLTPLALSWAEEPEPLALPELWYREGKGNPPFEAFEKKITRWMLSRNLPSTAAAIGPLIGVIAMMSANGTQLPTAIGEIQSLIRVVETSHIYILPRLRGIGWDGSLHWEGFRFERLDSDILISKCRKATATRFARSAESLHDVPSIASPVIKQPLVDLAWQFWRVQSAYIKKFGMQLLEAYLQAASEAHVDAMWAALEDAFVLPNALGLHLFNFTELRWLPSAEVWTFYDGLGPDRRHCWLGKQITTRPVRIPRFDQAAPALESMAKSHGFAQVKMSPLFPLLMNVSRSLAKSQEHLVGERISESFLFLIIAIEQVFSQKENTTQAIASRTAVVAHRVLNMDYSAAKRHISRLYDVRSKFVHQGKPATNDDRVSANDLGVAVVKCIIRLCRGHQVASQGFHERWLKHLDYLVAAIEAGKPLSHTELVENGIVD